jgi:hypothetical protein
MAAKPRPLPPADINPWGKTVDEDVIELRKTTERLSVNVGAALQVSGNAAAASKLVAATSDILADSSQPDVVLPSTSWASGSVNLPSVSITSPTGRIEVTFGGAIRNGSARICFSVSGGIVSRDEVRDDFSRCLALTGGATFPSSGHRSEVIYVGEGAVTVSIQVWAEMAGVRLSASRVSVRPAL